MKVALVVAGRLENRYAVEFVKYYYNLGFDHIYIIDNNKDGEEHFEDVLQQYIDDQFITILDYRNIEAVQYNSYIKVYYEINDKYDWIFYCDFDEFLILNEDNNIKEYLNRQIFNHYDQILINCQVYGDNNLIYDDGRGCLERFTKPAKDNVYNQYVKYFVRPGLKNITQPQVHLFKNERLDHKTCNNFGHKCECMYLQPQNYKLAYIKHFSFKTVDEYIHNKYKRGTGDRDYKRFLHEFNIENFFVANDITDEKIKYLKEHNIDVSRICM